MSFEIRNENLTDKDDFGGVELSDLVVIDSTALGTSFKEGQYPHIKWVNTHSNNVSFQGSVLSGDFDSSSLKETSFKETEIPYLNLSNSTLKDCLFKQTKASNLMLIGTRVISTAILSSEFKDLDCSDSNCKFENVLFNGSVIKDDYLTGFFADHIELSQSKIQSSTFIFKNSS